MSLIKRNQEKRKDGKILFKKIKKQVQGITLIALVVTVIVLLILAGVAINLTVGDNGLFRKAQNAADTWQMAEQNEQSEMEQAGDFIEIYQRGVNTATTVKDAIDQDGFYLENTKIKDDLDNEVVIPARFKLASDSATKVEDGIVIEDLDGNQFVWIPAKTEDKGGATIKLSAEGTATIIYNRTEFTLAGDYSNYSETMPSDELQSVNDNGGYYIGRYEAGDKESTVEKTMRNENSSQTNTITIKKGQVPYNWITYENAKILAESMDTKQGYATSITKLTSSYAWDTALNFIQIKDDNYATNPSQGNYANMSAFTFTDIEGNENQHGPTGDLIPTGQTKDVSNIFDMGGNLYEVTTETVLDVVGSRYACRGGAYYNNYGTVSPGYRDFHNTNAFKHCGFRVALYI